MKIEITVRDIRLIQDIITIIQGLHPTQVNLTDKNGLSDNLMIIETIKDDLPDINFVPHYSFKNHTTKDKTKIVENYTEYLTDATKHGIGEILLVSGNPRPKLDTIEGLKMAQEIFRDNEIEPVEFSVAYNPFLSGHHLLEEQKRLEKKLEVSDIKRVYLQVGSLTHPLRRGIEFVRSLGSDIEVIPSVVVPSANFLRKFQFRPWKGVVLDDKYLSNIKNATEKTKDLLTIMKEMEVDPLIEFVSITNVVPDDFFATYGDFIQN